MSVVLLYVLSCLVTGVHAQLGITHCGALTVPENGAVDSTAGTTTGDTAQFECNIGYKINGSSLSTCVADTGWNNTETICVHIDCGALAAPENGVVNTAAGTALGDIAQFECNNGYQINGSRLSTCVVDTGWDNTEITCVPEPATIEILFVETTMFIGLIAGLITGVLAFIFVPVYYVVSKRCCDERNNYC